MPGKSDACSRSLLLPNGVPFIRKLGSTPRICHRFREPARAVCLTSLPHLPARRAHQCRQYSCSMALYNRHKGCVLLGVGLGSLMSALAVKQGDRLQLQPAGSHTARATLVKPAAAAALMPGQPAAAAGAAAAPSAASSGQGGSGHPHGGRPLHIPSPAPLPPRRPGPPTNWRGLEPADSGRYSLLLSRNVVQGERRAGMPGKMGRDSLS